MNRINSYLETILDALFFEGTSTKRGCNSLRVAVSSFIVTTISVFTVSFFSTSIVWQRFTGFVGVNLFFGIIFYVGYKTNGFEKDPINWVKNLLLKKRKHVKI